MVSSDLENNARLSNAVKICVDFSEPSLNAKLFIAGSLLNSV